MPPDEPRKIVPPPPQTDEQIAAVLAAIGRHKNNPDYLDRVFKAAEEARRQINEQELRQMQEQNK